MNGRFFIGVLSGAVLTTGAFVVGSVMFPVGDGLTPVEVANAPEPPVPASEVVAAETGSVGADAGQTPAPEQKPEVQPEVLPEPEPEPAPEPAPEPLPEVAPEPVPEPAADPDPSTAETGAKADAASGKDPDASSTALAEGVTEGGSAPADASAEPASADPVPLDTAPADDPGAASGSGAQAPVAEAPAEPPAAAPVIEPPADAPAVEVQPDAPAPAQVTALPQAPAAPVLPDADSAVVPVQPLPVQPLPEPPLPEPPDVLAEAVPEPAPLPQTDGMVPATEPPAGNANAPQAEAEAEPPADLPEAEAAPLPDAGQPAPAGEAPPDGLDDDASDSTFKPTPGLGDKTEGVVIGRLPRIGDAPAAEAPDSTAPEAAEVPAEVDSRPIAAFAAPFENPEAKPLLALVLIDPGTADLDRAGLAALPFPVSFALDPLDPATPERAAIYRAAGKEVVMLATGIAEGAQASDIEVAFQSMAQGLPEAVAVMDLAEPLFQDRRPLASIVVPVIGAQGRGLLTWDQGLNAADQVARRDDVPAAVVFRDLAPAGSDSDAVRRILDRAVFKSAQDGRVAVAGTATPDLVTVLLEWAVEGRAATVALAPLTAVLAVE